MGEASRSAHPDTVDTGIERDLDTDTEPHPDTVDTGIERDLDTVDTGIERDLDTVDAALCALDSDDVESAEALAAELGDPTGAPAAGNRRSEASASESVL